MKSLPVLFVFLLVIISTQLSAQHFDWACSGSGMNNGMHLGVVTPTGDVITGMQYEQPSFYPLNQWPVMYSANGDSLELGMIGTQMIIYGYDKSGNIKWTFRGDQVGYRTSLLGLTLKKNGNIIAAYSADWVADDVRVLKTPEQLTFEETKSEEHSANPIYDGDEEDANSRFDGRSTDMDGAVVFSEFNSRGEIISTIALEGLSDDAWTDFKTAPDGGYVIAYEDEIPAKDVAGVKRDVAHHFTIKLGADFNLQWVHKVMYLDKSCCSTYVPPCAMEVGEDGDVYITGNVQFGVRLDGAKDHMAPVLDKVDQYNPPYDSYIARLGADGKLKWVKYTEAKSLIDDIAVDAKNIYVCGRIQLKNNFLGLRMDTTADRHAFIAGISKSGKAEWVHNYTATTVKTLAADQSGNVCAMFTSKNTNPLFPLIIGEDTLKNSYTDLIVAAFSEDGKWKWTKTSKVSISDGEDYSPVLMNDYCGNLYVVAEMWYVLPMNMSIFDAALVRGRGYGAAPLVARLRTTLPEELEALNPNLVHHTSPDAVPAGGSETAEGGNCVPIPFPWKLEVMPNPNKGIFTARATLSYTDMNVTLELWDSRGRFIRTLQEPRLIEAGQVSFPCNVMDDVTNGLYILVLKGSGSAVSQRVLIAK